jgi:hypothetical protein
MYLDEKLPRFNQLLLEAKTTDPLRNKSLREA